MALVTANPDQGDNAALEAALSEQTEEQPNQETFADPNKFFAYATQPDEEQTEQPAEEQEAAPVEGEEVSAEEVPEEEQEQEAEEQTVQGSRAQKRIQSLSAEKKRLTEQLSGTQQQFQMVLQQQQQLMQQQLQMSEQKYAQQMQLLQSQLQAQAAEYNKLKSALDRTEEEGLSDLEKYERKLLAQAEARAEAKLKAQLEPLTKELESEKQKRNRLAEDFKRKAEIVRIRKEAAAARAEALYQGFDETTVADKTDAGDALVLTWSAAFGEAPAEAAKHLRAYLDWYADTRAKVRSKAKATPQTTSKPQVGKKLPASPAGSVESVAVQRSTTGLPVADRDALRANGYLNYFEWQKAGFPPLRKKSEG